MSKNANSEQATNASGSDFEQTLYARILAVGMYIGLAGLILTFIMYVSEVVHPYVPFDKLSQCWVLSVGDYLDKSGCPNGWSWVSMLRYGDFMNFISIAILAGLTLVCYVSIIPFLIKKGDRIYAAIAIIEVLVLAFAASGIVSSGH